MASEINRAYHAALRKAQYINIGHAIKSNSEQALRNRCPDFRGTKTTATSTAPRLFFTNKDEARVPWKDLINVDLLCDVPMDLVGGGVEPSLTGALATPAGRSYAKQQLQRKAMDLEQIRSMIPMPIETMAQAAASKDDVQRRQFEITLIMRQVVDAMGDGSADAMTIETLRRAVPSIIDISAFLQGAQLNELRELALDGVDIGRDVPDVAVAAPAYQKARDALTILFRKIGSFIASMMKTAGEDIESRKSKARAYANAVFKGDELDAEFAAEDIPAQANDPRIERQQLRDEDTRPVMLPESPDGAVMEAAGEINPDILDRILKQGASGQVIIAARNAYNQIWDEIAGDKELKRAMGKDLPKTKSTAPQMRTMNKVIKRYAAIQNRLPADLMRFYRGAESAE